MRTWLTATAIGTLAIAALVGCGGSQIAEPATLTDDEEAAAAQELQAVEDEERAHALQRRGG